jgi:hypothetical protein
MDDAAFADGNRDPGKDLIAGQRPRTPVAAAVDRKDEAVSRRSEEGPRPARFATFERS